MLAYCVPDLKLDGLFVYGNVPGSELHTNGEVVLLAEALVRKLEQQAGLADTWRLERETYRCHR